jgi:hypothetical protein
VLECKVEKTNRDGGIVWGNGKSSKEKEKKDFWWAMNVQESGV